MVVPFVGLSDPAFLALDKSGDLYVVDAGNDRVLELPKGSSTQIALPFTGLGHGRGIAVDRQGDVFVSDSTHNQVLELVKGP